MGQGGLRHRVEIGDIPAGGPAHQPELVQAHHRIVPELDIHSGELSERLKQARLLFQKIERHLRMEPNAELAFASFVACALECALQTAGHDFGGKHPPSAGAGGAIGGHRMPE